MKNRIALLISTILLFSLNSLESKKHTLQGFGKISKSTKRIKTKIVRPHIKKTRKGYTTVNAYAKS